MCLLGVGAGSGLAGRQLDVMSGDQVVGVRNLLAVAQEHAFEDLDLRLGEAFLRGELGGDPMAIPILLGLGLHELSMNPNAIPDAKEIVRNWTMEDAREVALRALDMESAEQVREMMKTYID